MTGEKDTYWGPFPATREFLCQHLRLRDDPVMQDWELENADPMRTEEFLAFAATTTMDLNAKTAVLVLALCSLEKALNSGDLCESSLPLLRRILADDPLVTAQINEIWIESLLEQFPEMEPVLFG